MRIVKYDMNPLDDDDYQIRNRIAKKKKKGSACFSGFHNLI